MRLLACIAFCLTIASQARGQNETQKPVQPDRSAAQNQRTASGTPSVVQQVSANSGKTTAEQHENNEAEHARHERLIAYSTLALAILTLLLALATGVLARFTYKLWGATNKLATDTHKAASDQLRVMQGQLDAMKKQEGLLRDNVAAAAKSADAATKSADVSRESLTASQRAWVVPVDLEIHTGLVWRTDQAARIGLRLTMKNTGQTPAFEVLPSILGETHLTVEPAARQRAERVGEGLVRSAMTWGGALYPAEKLTLEVGVIIKFAKRPDGKLWSEFPLIIGWIDYRLEPDGPIHHSSFLRELVRFDATNVGIPKPIDRSVGNIPKDLLGLQPSFRRPGPID